MSPWKTEPTEETETRIVSAAEIAAVIATGTVNAIEMTVVAGIAAS